MENTTYMHKVPAKRSLEDNTQIECKLWKLGLIASELNLHFKKLQKE